MRNLEKGSAKKESLNSYRPEWAWIIINHSGIYETLGAIDSQ